MLKDLSTRVHEDIFSELIVLFQNQRLPHALLFVGASGIGKKELAIEFAKILLQDNFNAELHLFSPETSMQTYSIDQIRKLQDICKVKPYNGSSRVIILDQADRLGTQPSNAFLKLLEEPPPFNYFILITSQAYKLLPTLLSRLQKFQFKRPKEEFFKLMLEEKKWDLGPFSFLAEGSIGKALLVNKYKKYFQNLAQLLPFSYREEIATYRQFLEAIDEDETFDMLEFIPLFEAFILDYYGYTNGLKQGFYPWDHLKSNQRLSYMNLKKAFKELSLGKEAGIKTSCCFERFFFSL